MKALVTIFILANIISLISFCKLKNKKRSAKYISAKSVTTLDSLQGIWISTADSLWQWTINGRNLEEVYKDNDKQYEYFIIFFSDTLVDGENYDFSQLKIDTLATSGKYLITKTADSNHTVLCYEIEGFFKKGTVLSLMPTWVNKRPNIFEKKWRRQSVKIINCLNLIFLKDNIIKADFFNQPR